MSVVKALRFPVSVHWRGGRLTCAEIPGKPRLEVATPPEFRGGIEGVWSPEDLLVTAAASCFMVTFLAFAERMGVPLLGLDVTGTGHVSRRDDGRFGFVAIELDVSVETTTSQAAATAEEAARSAEERCLVSMALDVPVHVAVTTRQTAPLAAAHDGRPA